MRVVIFIRRNIDLSARSAKEAHNKKSGLAKIFQNCWESFHGEIKSPLPLCDRTSELIRHPAEKRKLRCYSFLAVTLTSKTVPVYFLFRDGKTMIFGAKHFVPLGVDLVKADSRNRTGGSQPRPQPQVCQSSDISLTDDPAIAQSDPNISERHRLGGAMHGPTTRIREAIRSPCWNCGLLFRLRPPCRPLSLRRGNEQQGFKARFVFCALSPVCARYISRDICARPVVGDDFFGVVRGSTCVECSILRIGAYTGASRLDVRTCFLYSCLYFGSATY